MELSLEPISAHSGDLTFSAIEVLICWQGNPDSVTSWEPSTLRDVTARHDHI